MHDTRIKVPLRCRYVIVLALVFVTQMTHAATISSENLEELEELPPSLPCKLLSNNSLDCSNLSLTEIPKNLPKHISHLNLSFNSLRLLEDEAFKSWENLQFINLSHNLLADLSRKTFRGLKKLEVVILDYNNLTKLNSEVFLDLKALRKLSLVKNSIDLYGSGSDGFLIQPAVLELNLDQCEVRRIPERAFSNMTQLTNLTLAGNPIDNDLDVRGFQPLQSLINLRIPNISKSSIYNLCNTIGSIDAILFDEYNISCLLLASEENRPFEDSIIINDSIELPKSDSVISYLMTTKRATSAQPTIKEISSTSLAPPQSSDAPEMITEHTTHIIQTFDEPSTNKTKIDTATAEVDISNETIKYILVGIFGVTIVGILIGLICRADICGIKTKLCRSKKNRRTPTDTVSPFEEIPLNSNGKTTEGQG